MFKIHGFTFIQGTFKCIVKSVKCVFKEEKSEMQNKLPELTIGELKIMN